MAKSPPWTGVRTEDVGVAAGDGGYYIAVTACETLGREGWYSNEVSNLAMLTHSVYPPLIAKEN